MANQIQPSIGRIVILKRAGQIDAPAVITRVWTRDCVNLHVLPDCDPAFVLASVCYEGTYGDAPCWAWPERV